MVLDSSGGKLGGVLGGFQRISVVSGIFGGLGGLVGG